MQGDNNFNNNNMFGNGGNANKTSGNPDNTSGNSKNTNGNNPMKNEKAGDISKSGGNKALGKTENIQVTVPTDIPKESFQLEKLSDGFRITGSEYTTSTNSAGSFRSTSTFSIEQHYGKMVKDATGGVQGNGMYGVTLTFEE